MPPSNGTKDNREMSSGKKDKAQRKPTAYGTDDTSSIASSEVNLGEFADRLKRVTDLAQMFHIMMPDEHLEAIERSVHPQLRRQKEIERLENAMKAMRDERELERNSLDAKGQTLERERKECEDRKESLQLKQGEVDNQKKELWKVIKAELELTFEKEKDQLDREKRKEVATLQSQIKKLTESNKKSEKARLKLSQDLETTRESLKGEQILKGALEMKMRSLMWDQEKLESEIAVRSESTDYYTNGFKELSEGIQKVVRDRFGKWPESLEKYEDFKGTLKELEASSEIFRYTPAAASDQIADFLRFSAIEHIISAKVCGFITKPFIDECSPDLSGSEMLGRIRERLSGHSKRSGDIWTALTVKGTESYLKLEALRKPIVQDLLNKLGRIAEPCDCVELENDLTSIVDGALELWTALRSDSCTLDIDFKPCRGLDGKKPWLSEVAPSLKVDQYSSSGSEKMKSTPPSIALFPRVVMFRDGGEDTNTANASPNGHSTGSGTNGNTAESHVIYPGRALFSNSDAFVQGIRLQQELEKLYHTHMSSFQSSFHQKRMSLSSPGLDRSFAFPQLLPLEQRDSQGANGDSSGVQAGGRIYR